MVDFTLRKPSEMLAEVTSIPDSRAHEKLVKIIESIEASDRWREKNRGNLGGTNEWNDEWTAYDGLTRMPAQMLARGAGAQMTNEQRLQLVDGLARLIAKKLGTAKDVLLNATYLVAIGASGKGGQEVHNRAFPLMMEHFTVHLRGIQSVSDRRMAKNYLDFIFRRENIAIVSVENMEKAKGQLEEDIMDQEEMMTWYSNRGQAGNARQCAIRVETRKRYLQAANAELRRRSEKKQRIKI